METWIKTDNKWHHVTIIVNDENEKKTYLDGELFSTERISSDGVKSIQWEKAFTSDEIEDIQKRGIGN